MIESTTTNPHETPESTRRACMPQGSLDDAVVRAQHGDHQAFRHLYDKYLRYVMAIVGRLLGYSQDTEDIVQEVFVKAWRKLPALQQPAQFQWWLGAIARNTALSHRKQEDSRQKPVIMASHPTWRDDEIPDTDPLLEIASEGLGPEALALLNDEQRALHRVLMELPVDDRQVLILSFFDDLKAPEIASILGIANDAVRQRKIRALKRLRQRIERDDPAA